MIRQGSKDVEDLSPEEKDELLQQLVNLLINTNLNDHVIGQMLILLEEKKIIQ